MKPTGMHVIDWVVFALLLALSGGVGIYHSFTGGRQKTTREYLSGGNKIPLIPASLSFSVSFISAILILGYPAEIYVYGGQFILNALGYFLGYFLSSFIYVPVLYPLKTLTSNEYVDLRFKSKVLTLMVAIYTIFQSILYAAIVCYGQATAIQAVSGFPTWGTIIVAMVVAVIYTTLGGLRGVIWTDVFQATIMAGGVIAISVVGFIKIGSLQSVFELNNKWGRLKIFDFDPDPTKRINFWGVMVGTLLTGISIAGHKQAAYQRYAAMPTLAKAKWVPRVAGLSDLFFGTIACLSGWVVFAYFTDIGCDPLKAKYVSNPNQLIPYFAATALSVPGFPGLFLSSVAAGALSTVSSILNATTAIAWNDIIKPYVKVSDEKATILSKCLVVVFGVLVVFMAIFVQNLGGTIVQMFGTFSSSLAGPVSGVFLVGMFFPWSNWKGASVGCLMGTAVSLWIGFGSYTIDRSLSKLPTTSSNCTLPAGYNSTLEMTTDIYSNVTETLDMLREKENLTGVKRLYAISFFWMREVATLTSVLVTIFISFITGKSNPNEVEPRLLHPWIRSYFSHGCNTDTQKVSDKIELEEKEGFLSH